MKITSIAVVLVGALGCLFLFTNPALGEDIVQRQKRASAYDDLKARFHCNKYGYQSSACRVAGDDVLRGGSAKAKVQTTYEIRDPGRTYTAQECSDAKAACVGGLIIGSRSDMCTAGGRFTLKECARLGL